MNYPTWSDLNSHAIVPPSGARHIPDSGPVAVMVSCEPDLKWLTSRFPVKEPVPFISSTLTECRKACEGISIVGPFVGAPYAVMLLETLIARGVKKVLVMGWCGALTEKLDIGDIVIPKDAIVDEGTSASYRELDQDCPVSMPDSGLAQELMAIDANKISVQRLWTTDAIYRETPEKIQYFKNLGAACVDMECSALFSVAGFRKIPVAAGLVVSDRVMLSGWEPGFSSKVFRQSRQDVCDGIMHIAKKIR